MLSSMRLYCHLLPLTSRYLLPTDGGDVPLAVPMLVVDLDAMVTLVCNSWSLLR